MKQPLTEAWAVIARLQNSRATSKSEADIRACEVMIDRQLDRIAANQIEPDDPAEVSRIVAAAGRRERHRAKVMRLHGPHSNWGQFLAPSSEAIYEARQTLGTILAKSSPEDVSLLLSAGLGETPQIPGLALSSARKRLCRLRARLSHLAPYLAGNVAKLGAQHPGAAV